MGCLGGLQGSTGVIGVAWGLWAGGSACFLGCRNSGFLVHTAYRKEAYRKYRV